MLISYFLECIENTVNKKKNYRVKCNRVLWSLVALISPQFMIEAYTSTLIYWRSNLPYFVSRFKNEVFVPLNNLLKGDLVDQRNTKELRRIAW